MCKEKCCEKWVEIDQHSANLPLNTCILAKNQHTICAIQKFNGNWTFWHSNTNVPPTFINEVTHYLIPTL